MNRIPSRIPAGLALMIVGGVLVGCSFTDEPAGRDEAQVWLDQLDLDIEGAVAAFSGRPSPEFGTEASINVGFEDGSEAEVTYAEFSCFGTERMGIELTIQQAGGEVGLREEDLRCDEGPHRIEMAMDAVGAVRAEAVSADGAGAWSVIVYGDVV